jgi:hypothetical protein
LKTQEAITKLGTVLPHPTLQLRCCSSYFHLFGALEDSFRGKRFGSDDEVVEEVKDRAKDLDWHALVCC